jgi:hypothetical protein
MPGRTMRTGRARTQSIGPARPKARLCVAGRVHLANSSGTKEGAEGREKHWKEAACPTCGSAALEPGNEQSLLNRRVKIAGKQVRRPILPQSDGAKALSGELEKALFGSRNSARTGWVEVMPCVAVTVHNDVGVHGETP